MAEREEIQAVIDTWNKGLDSGDIETMVSTCHENTMPVNERQPVTVGTQAIRDKYIPRCPSSGFLGQLAS